MSDHDEDIPLTRRERRLRDQSAEAELPVEDDREAEVPTAVSHGVEEDIEISPYDEQGNLRSRREMRELREAALAELARQRGAVDDEQGTADETTTVETESVEPESVEPEPVEPESVKPEPFEPDIPGADPPATVAMEAVSEELVEQPAEDDDDTEETPDAGAEDFDPRLAPTQALSIEELKQAELDAESDVVGADDDLEEDPGDEEGITEAPAPKRAGLFSRFKKNGTATSEEAISEESVSAEASASADSDATPVDQTPDSTETEPRATQDAAADDEYSFPDIAPLDESRSVFDDPTVQTLPDVPTGQVGVDFEDMINRAVSDEGSGRTNGTASLILPSLPETDDLSGPLGETGELYITGSFELPKSLGETGGHSRVQDSSDSDPFSENEPPEEYSTDPGSSPVSAASAVSSRFTSGTGLVTPETKKDNKKTIILASSGAVLLLAIIGGAVWAWNAGLFG